MTKRGPTNWRQHVLTMLPTMEARQAASFQPAPANPQPFSGGLHLQPQFDPIELLPPAAAEKLRMLRQRSADMRSFRRSRMSARRPTRIEAENALKRLTDHPQDFGFNLPPTDPRVVAANKHLAKVTADLERLKERSEVRTAAWQAASRCAGCLRDVAA